MVLDDELRFNFLLNETLSWGHVLNEILISFDTNMDF